MDKKSGLILSGLEQGPEEWEHAFFKGLFRAFGLPANEHAFESLAERWLQVPSYRTLGAGEQEALLFYLSGLASTSPLAYPQQLMAHGRELAAGIPPGSPALWSFLRMRPASFPTIRLALLASLLPSICDIPLLARPGPSASDWLDLLRARAAGYWDDHFTFGSVSPRNWPKSIGTQLRTSLIANAISPFYTAYGKYSDDHSFIRKAMALLDASAPENNRITRQWQALRLHKPSGTESQGLLELFHSYCTPRRCLECRIGYLVLRSD